MLLFIHTTIITIIIHIIIIAGPSNEARCSQAIKRICTCCKHKLCSDANATTMCTDANRTADIDYGIDNRD